jgi:hypothetical protein
VSADCHGRRPSAPTRPNRNSFDVRMLTNGAPRSATMRAPIDKVLDMSSARACGHGCSWILVLNVVSFARFPTPATSIGRARYCTGRRSRLDPRRKRAAIYSVFVLMHTYSYVFGAQGVTPAGARLGGQGRPWRSTGMSL